MQKLLDALVRGQTTANTLNGFLEHGDENTRALISQVGKSIGELASSAADRLRRDDAPMHGDKPFADE